MKFLRAWILLQLEEFLLLKFSTAFICQIKILNTKGEKTHKNVTYNFLNKNLYLTEFFVGFDLVTSIHLTQDYWVGFMPKMRFETHIFIINDYLYQSAHFIFLVLLFIHLIFKYLYIKLIHKDQHFYTGNISLNKDNTQRSSFF